MEGVFHEMSRANRAQRVVAVGATSRLLVDESDYRVSLVLENLGAAVVTLSFLNPAVAGEGITLPAANVALHAVLDLSLILHGRLLRGPIFAVATGGSNNVVVWEALHPCPCLRGGEPRG